jgi:hypothetical protein
MWLELSIVLGVVCVIAIFFSWQLLSEKLRVMDSRIEELENKLGIKPEENDVNDTA